MVTENNSALQTTTDINGESIVEEITSQVSKQEEKDKVKTKLYELGFLELFNLKNTGYDEAALDLYKKEYEVASIRFENIYKAIWQNFSYMSVVAGGLLTFGNNFFTATTNSNNKYLVTFLACVPLLFWYVSTFVPMNEYGYKAADELAEIEVRLNTLFGTQMNHFRSFKKRRNKIWHIFTSPSVRSMMLVFFLILSIIAFTNFINAFQLLPLIEEQKTTIFLISFSIFIITVLIRLFIFPKNKKKKVEEVAQVNNPQSKNLDIKSQTLLTFIISSFIIWAYFAYQYLMPLNVFWSLWVLGLLLASDIWIILLEAQRIYERVLENPNEDIKTMQTQ